MSNVVKFPSIHPDHDGTPQEEWDRMLVDLHSRLTRAMMRNRTVDRIRVVLTIEDV